MKNLMLIAFAFFCANVLSAQWKVGLKSYLGVIAQSPAHIEVMPMSDHNYYNLDFVGSSPVKSLGFMMYNDLGPIFIQTEFLGTAYRLDFLIDGYKEMTDGAHLMREQYYILEIPVNAGLMISDFKIGLGPVMELNLDIDSELSAIDSYKNHTRKMDFSFQAMAGYRKGIFHIDIKYINKFASISDGFSLGSDIMNYKRSANRLMFGLGFTF